LQGQMRFFEETAPSDAGSRSSLLCRTPPCDTISQMSVVPPVLYGPSASLALYISGR